MLSLLVAATGAAAAQPNIWLVVADDLGYNDVSMHGSEVKTPFLDSLALGPHSVHLDNYYGHMICTPSRASLMSGRYASHTGLQHSYLLTGTDTGLPLKFRSIAEQLNDVGYSSHAVGKW
jgi:arylsulfatase B/arylsulfatase I/J